MPEHKMTDRCLYPLSQSVGARMTLQEMIWTPAYSWWEGKAGLMPYPTFEQFDKMNKLAHQFLDNAWFYHEDMRVGMAWCPEDMHPGSLPHHKDKLYKFAKAKRKAHEDGVAVDIYSTTETPSELMRILVERDILPFQRICLEAQHVHVECDAFKPFTKTVGVGGE